MNLPWLLAVGAVALPIVVHLIRAERFRRCELATIRFLAAVVQERGGRRRIANWPLLIVRALAVIVLAFLVARPFRPGGLLSPASGEQVLILCDVSGSETRKGAPDLAALVERYTSRLPKETRVTLARFADRPEVISGSSALRPIAGASTDFPAAVNWAVDRRVEVGSSPGRVIFISDFSRGALRKISPRVWPANTALELEPTGAAHAWNLGIERVESLTPIAASRIEAEVSLRSCGAVPRKAARIRLKIEGLAQPLDREVPAGQMHARFVWETTIPAEGLLVRGTAEIAPSDGDAVVADDSRPFAFPVTRQRSVLLVDGDPGETVFGNETYFLDKALAVTSRSDELPFFRPETRRQLGDPHGFDVVALCNVASLSPVDIKALGSFVAAGGNLLVTLGSQTKPSLFEALSAAGIAFGTLAPIATPTQQASVFAGPVHPALRGLGNSAADDWPQIAFWPSFALQRAAGVKVLLAFRDGSPLLVEAAPSPAGGRSLAFLHSVDRQDSEFPREQLFVPWAREVFRYLTHASDLRWNVREVVPSLTETRPAGVYIEDREVAVVAPAPEEIDIVPATPDEARAALGGTRISDENAHAAAVESQFAAGAAGGMRPRELWPVLALVLFTVVLVESLLASRSPST